MGISFTEAITIRARAQPWSIRVISSYPVGVYLSLWRDPLKNSVLLFDDPSAFVESWKKSLFSGAGGWEWDVAKGLKLKLNACLF